MQSSNGQRMVTKSARERERVRTREGERWAENAQREEDRRGRQSLKKNRKRYTTYRCTK